MTTGHSPYRRGIFRTGERAFAQLKSWRIMRRARGSTRRVSRTGQAIHALLTCDYSG